MIRSLEVVTDMIVCNDSSCCFSEVGLGNNLLYLNPIAERKSWFKSVTATTKICLTYFDHKIFFIKGRKQNRNKQITDVEYAQVLKFLMILLI